MAPSAPAGTTVTLRYPLQEAGDLILNANPLQSGECRLLTVRYLNNGACAQVNLALKAYDLTTGVTTTLVRFTAANNLQQHVSPCAAFDLFFADNEAYSGVPGASVYFVEAKLTRSASGGNPQLGGFGLLRNIP